MAQADRRRSAAAGLRRGMHFFSRVKALVILVMVPHCAETSA